ncbi:hypothetical protein QFZ28_004386 [Neobacillus niacini]|uniref:hypothetical protein n=1 Tax=Neobacillus niacini TaxID=86668 RepID=UPI00277E7912|nr:hypothetical protein [Neobacillus niacini]MDQ1003986.1 hypothetical protein [Neobacillus niacini]
MNVTKKDLLFVYDVLLHRKIQRAGHELLTSAISLADRKFWLYPRTTEIEQIMKEHVNNN